MRPQVNLNSFQGFACVIVSSFFAFVIPTYASILSSSIVVAFSDFVSKFKNYAANNKYSIESEHDNQCSFDQLTCLLKHFHIRAHSIQYHYLV